MEAIINDGKVEISLLAEENYAKVQIVDNGCGILPEVLSKLTNFGESHGKKGGSGLELHHARRCIESWGGRIAIESKVDTGTKLLLYVPLEPAPNWFVQELDIGKCKTIVIIDDDQSIHQIWDGRLEPLDLKEKDITTIHLSNPEEFKNWFERTRKLLKESVLFLVDYEFLGFKEVGLDLIEQYRIADSSILVTSRYEEIGIREKCLEMGVPLIPKGIAGLIPIRI